MTFETFLGMFLTMLVTLAETLTAFCSSVKRRLDASKTPDAVKAMASKVETPVAPPPESQGGHAPTLPHGSLNVDLTPVYIPRVPGASNADGRITPVQCDLSGKTGVDSKGESYTIVGLALNDAKNRLVCRHGKRAVLRFASDLTIAGAVPVNSAVNSVDNTPPANKVQSAPAVNTPPANKVQSEPAINTPPANKVQQTSVDKRTAQLFDALVSMGVPKTVASLQARSMAESEALESAKSTTTVAVTKVETVDPAAPHKAGVTLYPQSVPSGATRVVFYNNDGSPKLNTANQHHGFSVKVEKVNEPGSPAYKWVQGTHRLAVAVGKGELQCRYQ